MLDWLFAAPLEVGTQAPNFAASTAEGQRVTLSALRGKNVVLVFYPADDTLVCTQQLCEFRDNWAAVQSAERLRFGVNPAGAGRHKSFQQKHKLPFPLLIDEGKQIARAYNSWG